MLRWLLRAAGRAAYALLVLAVFALSAYFAFNQWVRRGVTSVPELAGMTEEQASALLADSGLAFRRAAAGAWSDAVPVGRVIETRPQAGALVKRGAAIEAVISQGARRVAVPEMAGKALPAARLMLASEQLEPGATLAVISSTGAPGTVVGQSPPAGVQVPAGSRVDLLVAQESSGTTWVMPDLVYRRYEAVRPALERRGLRFGNITFEPYEGIAEGTILRQSPLPGHPLRRTEAIALSVSTGVGAVNGSGVGDRP